MAGGGCKDGAAPTAASAGGGRRVGRREVGAHPLLAAGLLLALLAACSHAPQRAAVTPDPLASYVKARMAERLAAPGAGTLFLKAAAGGLDDERVRQSALFHLILEGRMAEAERLARALPAGEEGDDLPRLVVILAHLRAGEGAVALEAIEDLRARGFGQVVRPVLEAWAAALTGDADRALQALRPLESRYGLAAHVKMERALLLDFLGENERATTAYKGLVYGRGLPNLAPLVSYLALLQRTGHADEAKTVLADMEKAYPANAVLADVGRRIAAGRPLPAFAASPAGGVAVMLLELAEEIAREDLLRPAIIYARLAAWLAPALEEARVRLIDLLSRADYHEPARAIAETIPQSSPWWPAARRAAALAERRAGDMDRAIAILRDYLAGERDDIDGWMLLGDLLRLDQRYQDAVAAYDRAIAEMERRGLAPGWYPYFARGIAHERGGDWQQAEADFLVALDKKPDEPDLLNYLGYSWLDRGMRIDEAVMLIERAAELKPDDGAIVDSLGWAYYVKGDIARAVETLERAVLLMPNDPTINEHLGDAYWRAGRTREARFQWAHALAFGPEPGRRPVLERKLMVGLEDADGARLARGGEPGS